MLHLFTAVASILGFRNVQKVKVKRPDRGHWEGQDPGV